MKKTLLYFGILTFVLVAAVFYYNLANWQIGTKETGEGKQIKTLLVSSQKPTKKRQDLEKVISNSSIEKWGFGIAGDTLIYVNDEFSVIRKNLSTSKEDIIYKSSAGGASARVTSNGLSAVVQIFGDGRVRSFFVGEDSVKRLPDSVDGWAVSGLAGHIVKEGERSLLIEDSGMITNKFSRNYITSVSKQMVCRTLDFDEESLSGKAQCNNESNSFLFDADNIEGIYNNDQTALITYSKDAQGQAVLYNKEGVELLRLLKIVTSSVVATNEGFYIISKPTKFEDMANEENGVAFVSNKGDFRTMFDTNATNSYSFDSMIIGEKYIFLQEGSSIYKAEVLQ